MSGGMNAAFNGGDIGQAMLRGAGFGAVGSAAFGGIDYYYGEEWTLGRAAAYGIAGAGMGELSGQGWKSGAMFSGGIAFSRYAYNKIVGYDVTWEPGGDALPKGFTTMPYRGANNIGVQGKELSGRLWDDMWLEGGPVSRAANHILGVNAVAGMHDVLQVKLDEYIGGWARTMFNVPAMIPAVVITTSGQLATPTGMMQYFCRP